MKKIVALVLALVLALSLATVAFAADESYFSAKVGGMKMTGVTLKEVKAANEGKSVAVYAPVVTVNGYEIPMALNLVEATDADYDYVFVDGAKVTYLKNSINGQYTGEAKAVAGLALKQADDATCGDIIIGKDVALYEMNGKNYKAVGSWNLRTVAEGAVKSHVTEQLGDALGFTKADLDDAVQDFVKALFSGKFDFKKGGKTVSAVELMFTNPADFMKFAVAAILDGAHANYFGGDIMFRNHSNRYKGVDWKALFEDSTNALGSEDDNVRFWNELWGYNEYVRTVRNADGIAKLDDDGKAIITSIPGTIIDSLIYVLADGTDGAFPGIAGAWGEGAWDLAMGALSDVKDEVVGNILAALGLDAAETNVYKGGALGTDAKFYGESWALNIAREVLKQGTSVKALALVDGKLITLAEAAAATKVTKSYDTKTGALTATIDGDYYVVPHAYAADYATVAGKTALTKVYCETCAAEFDFIVGDETAATEKFGAGNFENITNEFKYAFTTKFLGKHALDWNWDTMVYDASWLKGTGYTWNMFDDAQRNIKTALDGKQLYIGTAVAAADVEVESAKTFDAGVALYAGMALMSVAGSAVVIGKKKEF